MGSRSVGIEGKGEAEGGKADWEPNRRRGEGEEGMKVKKIEGKKKKG